MSNSKTDKIRKRLKAIEQMADQSSGNALSHQLKMYVPSLLDALGSVVEECEAVSMVDGRGRLVNTNDLLDIIADELDVEES